MSGTDVVCRWIVASTNQNKNCQINGLECKGRNTVKIYMII